MSLQDDTQSNTVESIGNVTVSSGLYIFNGTQWVKVTPYRWNGLDWVQTEPCLYTYSSWNQGS